MANKKKTPFAIDCGKLQGIRTKANISAKDFAEKVGKKPPHISNYETGVANPPANVLLAYLIICKATPEEILNN